MQKDVRWAQNRVLKINTLPVLLILDSQLAQYKTDLLNKIGLLNEKFFPSFPEADLFDIINFKYPIPIIACPITTLEVKHIIMRLIPFKAPGPTLIPKVVFQYLKPLLLLIFQHDFHRSLEQGYYAKLFWDPISVKPQKDNYTLVKAYRSITLLDTIAKTLESILAGRISRITKIYYLLPDTHFGRKRNTSTEHNIHFLVGKIYAAWDRCEKASILMLDITRAFDNISQPWLIHNLCKKRLNPQLIS